MHHPSPTTCCVLHVLMYWGASLFQIGSLCPNPDLSWSQLLFFSHCLRQRSQHAFLMSLSALRQKWVEVTFSHGSRPHRTVDARMWHSHFSCWRKRDFSSSPWKRKWQESHSSQGWKTDCGFSSLEKLKYTDRNVVLLHNCILSTKYFI